MLLRYTLYILCLKLFLLINRLIKIRKIEPDNSVSDFYRLLSSLKIGTFFIQIQLGKKVMKDGGLATRYLGFIVYQENSLFRKTGG